MTLYVDTLRFACVVAIRRNIEQTSFTSVASVIRDTPFTARCSYASAVLGVVILSVRPSVGLSVCLSRACFVTNPKNLPAIFLYHMKGQSF